MIPANLEYKYTDNPINPSAVNNSYWDDFLCWLTAIVRATLN